MEKNAIDNLVSTLFVLVLNVVCILLCFALLIIDTFNPKTLCYLFCAGLITWGVALIVKFFMKKLYKVYNDYNFSIGVLCIICGCVGLVRCGDIVDNFNIFMGLIVLVIGIMALQSSVQLRAMESPFWFIQFIFSAIMILSSIVVLMDLSIMDKMLPEFPIWLLLICSIMNICSMPLVSFTIHRYRKHEDEAEVTEYIEVVEPDVEVLDTEVVERIEENYD